MDARQRRAGEGKNVQPRRPPDKSPVIEFNGGMANRAARAPETSLYGPVKAFLEQLGFAVKGEICGCDIVGVRPGEPPMVVITELKMTLTLELVLQGVERLRAADEVWLAVLATRRGRGRGFVERSAGIQAVYSLSSISLM